MFEFNGEGVGMNVNRGKGVGSDVVIVAQRRADNVSLRSDFLFR